MPALINDLPAYGPVGRNDPTRRKSGQFAGQIRDRQLAELQRIARKDRGIIILGYGKIADLAGTA